MEAVVLENVRSCYNVWNIIRTADAMDFDVVISWYTPTPWENASIIKTSLWAEKNIKIYNFYNPKKAIDFSKNNYWNIIASEITNKWKTLKNYFWTRNYKDIWIVFGNEISWLLPETLNLVDDIVFIPMRWKKSSLNVSQACAIFMRDFAIYNN